MKLLILTQKVNKNDAILGFFHRWIEEFSKHCDKLTVICLKKGEYDLPDNVKVLSLGKEGGVSRLKYIFRLYKYIWQERKNYDFVFVHMNVEYVVLCGILCKLLRKKIGLWYMHKSVTWKLRLAEKLSNTIFTATKESFRLKSDKLKILHHGIDSNLFSFQEKKDHQELILLSVSRISEIKNIHLMIDLLLCLKKDLNKKVILKIVGEAITEKDKKYLEVLKNKVDKLDLKDNIKFLGAIPNYKLPEVYKISDIFLNLSETGSLDKAILEAISCGTLVLTSNGSSKDMLPKELFIDDMDNIKDMVIDLLNKDSNKLRKDLSVTVKDKHSLDSLVLKILQNY